MFKPIITSFFEPTIPPIVLLALMDKMWLPISHDATAVGFIRKSPLPHFHWLMVSVVSEFASVACIAHDGTDSPYSLFDSSLTLFPVMVNEHPEPKMILLSVEL